MHELRCSHRNHNHNHNHKQPPTVVTWHAHAGGGYSSRRRDEDTIRALSGTYEPGWSPEEIRGELREVEGALEAWLGMAKRDTEMLGGWRGVGVVCGGVGGWVAWWGGVCGRVIGGGARCKGMGGTG